LALPDVPAELTPRAALEADLISALVRPPCLVSFSGGRDSSAVLAVAVHVARREGLEPPIPITARFPDVPGMEESAWQELVVGHLGLNDWRRVDIDDELDLLGPVSRRLVGQHGLLFPPSVSLLALLLERGGGSSLLTGVAGDSFFGGWRLGRLADAIARGARPAPHHLAALVYAASPRPARAWHLRRRESGLGWLRPDARRAVLAGWAAGEASEPIRWDRQVRWRARMRRIGVMARSIEIVAETAGSTLLNPFLGAPFLAALARAGGAMGFGTRGRLMERLFGDLLPEPVTGRQDKASSSAVFFHRESRRFADSWDGRGIDSALVDTEALRATWLEPAPDQRSALLLQSAWLLESRRSQRQEA
jgi:asparagine synthase (glutamine-hydrolysing)